VNSRVIIYRCHSCRDLQFAVKKPSVLLTS